MKIKWTLIGLAVLLFILYQNTVSFEKENGHNDPAAFVENRFREFQRLSRRNSIWDTPEGNKFVDETVGVERLAKTLLSQQWPNLVPIERQRFEEALKISLAKQLTRVMGTLDRTGRPSLKLVDSKVEGRYAQLTYNLVGDRSSLTVKLFLNQSAEGWKISNLKWDGKTLQKYYYRLSKKILDRYPLQVLIGELSERGYIILEDFEDDEVGKLPRNWGWRDRDNDKEKPYWVAEEEGNKFLRAEDTGQSVILGKQIRWNIKKYPYISWRWRIRAIPEGGDERYGPTVDSAAGLYVTYGKRLKFIPESVKFVWSSTLPVGSAMRRSGIGKPWMVVVGSGTQGMNQWQTFVYNAYEAYQKTFGGNPNDDALGVGVLSDANSTHSRAFADYDDIIVFQNAEPTGAITQFLEAE
jgi:hypothetical protein